MARPARCADPAYLRQFGLEAFRRGDLATALTSTDRLCRIQDSPAATDWLFSAFVHHRGGWQSAFAADLEHAMEAGWCDPTVLRAVIALHADTQTRVAACHALIGSQRAAPDDVRFALSRLSALGGRSAKRSARTPSGLAGWLAQRSGSAIALHVRKPGHERTPVRLNAEREGDVHVDWCLRSFLIEAEPRQPVELTVTLDEATVEKWTDAPRVLTTSTRSSAEASPHIEADVVVIVPIYADPSSLERCLTGLGAQHSDLHIHHVIVDDFSEDERVTGLGRRFCEDVDGTFIRHTVNAGFSAAINSALARVRAGDVLILNSDVELPPGAIARLHAAAHCADRIGTVGALSNDAGSASFPCPFERNPLLDAVDALAVDATAARVNAGKVVDVVSNLGSCLYVVDACRRAVGTFSHGYGRGYYEDVDFCFRAQEAGFRNVVATNVYFAHASSRSFGTAKRQLAAENRLVVEHRFPGLDKAETAFMQADPLRPLRAAIEEYITAQEGATIIIAASRSNCSASLAQRCSDISRANRVIVVRWTEIHGQAMIELRGQNGQLPQSLTFDVDTGGLERFELYLGRRQVERIEIFDGDRMPHGLATIFVAVAPCRWCAASSSEATFVAAIHASRMRSSADQTKDWPVMTWDAMSAASLANVPLEAGAGSARKPPRQGASRRLGILMPEACAKSELFVLALARHLRRDRDVSLHILGSCLNEDQLMAVGNVWVHGFMPRGETAEVGTKLDLAAVLSPYRDSHFDLLEAVSQRVDCPKAYFDWSSGRLPAQADDLALPANMDDSQAADRLVVWSRRVTAEPVDAS